MKDFENNCCGWPVFDSSEEDNKKLTKTFSKHMMMLLNFFHEGSEYSQEHKELWGEMCDAGNNILDNMVVWDKFGDEIVTITNWIKSMNITTNSKGFSKSLVKDTVSGNIGVLLCKGWSQVIGSRKMNVLQLAPLDSIIAFIYKENDEISIINMQDGVTKYLLSKNNSKKLEENTILHPEDITEEDIVKLSEEINAIDWDYMRQIASKYGKNSKQLADKLFEDGYITEKVKNVIKVIWLVIDIV